MGVIWGLPYLLIKVAVREVTPATLVFARTAIASVLLLPLAIARGLLRQVSRRWRPVLAYTAVEVAVPWVLLSSAERRLASSVTGLLVAAVPLVGTALAWATGGHEYLGRRGLVGMLIGLAGVVALVGLDLGSADLGAVAAVAVVVVGYAAGPLILARRLGDLPALGVVSASLGLTALVYAPAAIVQHPHTWPGNREIAAIVTLGVVCTALAFVLFFHLVAEVGPVRSTVITYVNTAVAVGLGVAFLGEPFTLGTAVGFVLIILGSVLATRRRVAPVPVR
jgi:drug/metabolite transporter (DMT)-like permease